MEEKVCIGGGIGLLFLNETRVYLSVQHNDLIYTGWGKIDL